MRNTLLALTLVALPLRASAQISIPFTFTPLTVAESAEVNANFTQLGQQALNRTGGTMTGTLTTQVLVPSTHNTYDLGTSGTRYQDLFLSGIVTVSGFGVHAFTGSGNGAQVVGIRNTLDGAANFARFQLGNNATDALGFVDAYAATYTSVGRQFASGVLIEGTGIGGLSIAATNASGTIRLYGAGASAISMEILGSLVAIGDNADAFLSKGLLINQLANDDEILAWKSSDVDHGVTTVAETDTYGRIQKAVAASGGVLMSGFSEGEIGLNFQGIATTANTTKTSAASGPVIFDSFLKSGTGLTGLSADGNLFVIRSNGSAKWFVDVEGDTYRDGTDNVFSVFHDVSLALAWEYAMTPSPSAALTDTFRRYSQYNADALIAAGILTPRDAVTGRHYYNESALLRVAVGAAWQIGTAQADLIERLTALEAETATLRQAVAQRVP